MQQNGFTNIYLTRGEHIVRPMVSGILLEGLSRAGKSCALRVLKRVHADEEEDAEISTSVLGEH